MQVFVLVCITLLLSSFVMILTSMRELVTILSNFLLVSQYKKCNEPKSKPKGPGSILLCTSEI